MRLDRCPMDRDLQVLSVLTPVALHLRMHEVGLRAGATVRVTHVAPFGGRVVAVGASRIALDSSTAGLIDVAVRP
ncbi:FeoA family protein [Actinotalea sp. K2]|uniref:FeoA family protein n=1 Tax=Actinotalea sp. K2 TaxID=2939438 RepID=UPI002017B3A9|nr:FeoA family protein [Actinotalea sp. K2]MCL3862438.1 ferrous iron transport protein A [Actinotalea sp. K2]